VKSKDEVLEGSLAAEGLRIGIVMSRFNEEVTEALLEACLAELGRLGAREDDLTVVTVPGALEIPPALQRMAQTDGFDALVAVGAVIRGETYHFEVVADNATQGVSQVQLSSGIPIANAILTTEDEEQAHARTLIKGTDAARVAVEMANLMRVIDDEC